MYVGVLLKFAFSVWKLGRKEINSRSNTVPFIDWFFFFLQHFQSNKKFKSKLEKLNISESFFFFAVSQREFWTLETSVSVKGSHYWLQKFELSTLFSLFAGLCTVLADLLQQFSTSATNHTSKKSTWDFFSLFSNTVWIISSTVDIGWPFKMQHCNVFQGTHLCKEKDMKLLKMRFNILKLGDRLNKCLSQI